MKKIFLTLVVAAIAVIGTGIFSSCKKEDGLVSNENNLSIEKQQKWVDSDGLWVGGFPYQASNIAVYDQMQRYGGKYYLIVGGKYKVFEVPAPKYNAPNPPIPPGARALSQQTIIGMKNVSAEMAKQMVATNIGEPEDELASLKTVIDKSLLEKVASGMYIISSIVESVDIDEAANRTTFEYVISFSHPAGDVITTKRVFFGCEVNSDR